MKSRLEPNKYKKGGSLFYVKLTRFPGRSLSLKHWTWVTDLLRQGGSHYLLQLKFKPVATPTILLLKSMCFSVVVKQILVRRTCKEKPLVNYQSKGRMFAEK